MNNNRTTEALLKTANIDFKEKKKELAVLKNNFNEIVVSDSEEDFVYARDKIKKLIENIEGHIENIGNLAESSEHPRAFEVLSNMIVHAASLVKDLYFLSEKRQKVHAGGGGNNNGGAGGVGHTNNNTFFVGSTAELQKLIKINGSPDDIRI